MKIINYLIILGIFCGTACSTTTPQDQSLETIRPNIIYIMADDLGYGDLGAYGQQIIQTPNLDQMASEGMKFTQHYAGSPVCAPSRCVLMTGKHTGRAYVRGNQQAEPYGQIPIPDQATTVAELMKQAGYVTGMVGKWGLGVENTSGDPTKQGFDFFYGYLDQVLAHNYYPEYLWRNSTKEYLENEVKYLDTAAWHKGLGSYSTKKMDYSHDLFTQEALDFIAQYKDTTFFLYIPYTIPHNNGEALPGEKQEVPDFGIYADRDWEKTSKGYAAMITRMDRDVGAILDRLGQLGLAENTLVIFTSDNGPMQEEAHAFAKRFNSNGPLRGGKRDVYEGGIRVPLIAWWPETITAGTQTDHISAFWDFLPTACELARVEVPSDVTGKSYLPALMSQEQPDDEYLYWEFPEKGFQVAIRQGPWKAVKTGLSENPEAPWQLYNLEQDIDESENIAGQHPDIIEKMDEIFRQAHQPSQEFPLPDGSVY
ncbi:MAG: arylsulfatase [Candidatus Cyclobacteriaceae bacterium M3_2C_046]